MNSEKIVKILETQSSVCVSEYLLNRKLDLEFRGHPNVDSLVRHKSNIVVLSLHALWTKFTKSKVNLLIQLERRVTCWKRLPIA